MTVTGTGQQTYALGQAPEEHERLRLQARVWEEATTSVLDRVGLGTGQRCLDVGCGPGETMRLMAERVGPHGSVVGLDLDPGIGAAAEAYLHRAGHPQCRVVAHDATADEPLPGGPYDLVYARLLLFHLPQRVEVLRRLWQAVAPGGCLVVQDYDLRSIGVLPALASVEQTADIMVDAFRAAGCDVEVGARLPLLFVEAGIGVPDGTDVSGRVAPLREGRGVLVQTLRSLLPLALARGVVTERSAAEVLAGLDRDVERFGDHPLLWPLLVGAWRRRDDAS